jgi:hypothetical protein
MNSKTLSVFMHCFSNNAQPENIKSDAKATAEADMPGPYAMKNPAIVSIKW